MTKEMRATVCRQEERIAAGGALLARRAEFEELFSELVEEAGRALEEGDLLRCAFLHELLIPRVEAGIRFSSI